MFHEFLSVRDHVYSKEICFNLYVIVAQLGIATEVARTEWPHCCDGSSRKNVVHPLIFHSILFFEVRKKEAKKAATLVGRGVGCTIEKETTNLQKRALVKF